MSVRVDVAFAPQTVDPRALPAAAYRALFRPAPAPAAADEGHELLPAQASFAFVHRMNEGRIANVIRFRLDLAGALDLAALGRAVAAVFTRQTALRTRLVQSKGAERQVVDAACALTVPVLDAAELGLSPDAGVEVVARLDDQVPYDLTCAPIARLVLIKHGAAAHTLVVGIHHVVADGPSIQIFVDELAAAYGAAAAGQAPELAPRMLHCQAAAAWREQAQAGRAEAEAFWAGKFPKAPEPIDLPKELETGADQRTYASAVADAVLPRPTIEALLKLGRSQKCTPFMTMTAAYGAFLHRTAKAREIVVSTPASIRGADTAGLIGCYINMLPIKLDIWDDPTFTTLLARTRIACVEAFKHQAVPFARIVEKAGAAGAGKALIQTMLFFVKDPFRTVTAGGLTISSRPLPESLGEADLKLEIIESAAEWNASVQASTDHFDPRAAADLGASFAGMLERLVAEPDEPIGTAPLATGAYAARILAQGRGERVAEPDSPSLVPALEAAFKAHVAREAVVGPKETWTYADLDRRARAVSARLAAEGIRPEEPVGIFSDRSPDYIAAILGVLRAGGCYLPLDPTYPLPRIRYMVENSGARFVLTTADLAPRLDGLPSRILDLSAATGADAAAWTPRKIPPQSLAYVMYTSGSTGNPKGVQIEQHSVMNLVRQYQADVALTPATSVLQFTSLSFDPSVLEIFATLTSGARLVLRSETMMGTADALMRFVERHGIGVVNLTTSFWQETVKRMAEEKVAPPPCWRYVSFIGEKADKRRVLEWLAQTGGRIITYNHYGPTEATVTATIADLTRCAPDLRRRREVSIGKSVRNYYVYVLDDALRPVPDGVFGELYIGGQGLARGYFGKPDVTADRFLPDPYGPVPGARIYRTGDSARFLATGEVEFQGRLDNQVKVDGFRVELGEIENAVKAHPRVEEAVVLLKKNGEGRNVLVAYVVPNGSAGELATELPATLRAALPMYMVPAAVVVMPRFPLTPNGKVDRKAMPDPAFDAPVKVTASAEPTTDDEQQVHAVWLDVLGIETLGVDDDFFAVGGHSLKAIQVISELSERFGIELPLRMIFDQPTVRQLAAAVRRVADEGDGDVALKPLAR